MNEKKNINPHAANHRPAMLPSILIITVAALLILTSCSVTINTGYGTDTAGFSAVDTSVTVHGDTSSIPDRTNSDPVTDTDHTAGESSVPQTDPSPASTVLSPETTVLSPTTGVLPPETTVPVPVTKPYPTEDSDPAKTVDFGAWYLQLVNPWNYLDQKYIATIEVTAIRSGGYSIDSRCADDYKQMIKDCKAAGNDPVVCSGFRSQATQEKLFANMQNKYIAQGMSEAESYALTAKSVAIPGTSEHQLGLAVDIVSNSNWNLNESQEKTGTQKWLMANSWKYGFILRYPSDKSEITGIKYEPWHYRYVGRAAAAEIYELGVCLEEYLAMHGIPFNTEENEILTTAEITTAAAPPTTPTYTPDSTEVPAVTGNDSITDTSNITEEITPPEDISTPEETTGHEPPAEQ
ncbi:MAG: M15 family metallopeptidase [Clostridia bacterium]|nr:M15 family metallopeptidase [Clostridia bacterium]